MVANFDFQVAGDYVAYAVDDFLEQAADCYVDVVNLLTGKLKLDIPTDEVNDPAIPPTCVDSLVVNAHGLVA